MAKIRLDSAGIQAVLNSGPVVSELASMAGGVKSAASGATAGGKPIPVTVRARTASGGRLRGSRPAYDVSLAHPAGLGVEGKRGTLGKAAASQGLQVRGGA